jgi:hypothetical protein
VSDLVLSPTSRRMLTAGCALVVGIVMVFSIVDFDGQVPAVPAETLTTSNSRQQTLLQVISKREMVLFSFSYLHVQFKCHLTKCTHVIFHSRCSGRSG